MILRIIGLIMAAWGFIMVWSLGSKHVDDPLFFARWLTFCGTGGLIYFGASVVSLSDNIRKLLESRDSNEG